MPRRFDKNQFLNAAASLFYVMGSLAHESQDSLYWHRLLVLVIPLGIACSGFLSSPLGSTLRTSLSTVFFLVVAYATCTLFPPRADQVLSVLAMMAATWFSGWLVIYQLRQSR
jgi:hypothetical protein